ncbi:MULTISPECIES: DUF2200 domain-containing protein [unclassified Facklamia]|uniref:DUF2200 domain-containing protein n=1 Tax=Aerococcaceae TaxID=186827 RepID=UPI0013B829A3|nr:MULTISPECIES: DUF2200 domain-containing protein [unclassified Facklamia]NEW63808.1 DUF2200 family protein [Facklamia sp. 252]NEW67279.1 DUF2200 family protein [Facklamia sp. 253]QQD65161.1 DUF2200 domain-containing protein [Aerococcaceae bacterium zg-252]
MSHKIYSMTFSSIYDALINKAQRKNRTKEEVDTIISWMTGYSVEQLSEMAQTEIDYQTFFKQAPAMNEARHLIKGSICGVKIQEIEDPLMRDIRYLDKLIDELAKGKLLEKILR